MSCHCPENYWKSINIWLAIALTYGNPDVKIRILKYGKKLEIETMEIITEANEPDQYVTKIEYASIFTEENGGSNGGGNPAPYSDTSEY